MYLKNTFSFAQIAFRKAARLFAGSYIVLFIALGGGLLSVRATQSRAYWLEEEKYNEMFKEFSFLKKNFKNELDQQQYINGIIQKMDHLVSIIKYIMKKNNNLLELKSSNFKEICKKWGSVNYDDSNKFHFLYDFFEKEVEVKKNKEDEFFSFLRKEYEMVKDMKTQVKKGFDGRLNKAQSILDEGHAELLKDLDLKEDIKLIEVEEQEIDYAIQKAINALQVSDETYLKDFNKLESKKGNIIKTVTESTILEMREKHINDYLKDLKELESTIAELEKKLKDDKPKDDNLKSRKNILKWFEKGVLFKARAFYFYLYGIELDLKKESGPEVGEDLEEPLKDNLDMCESLLDIAAAGKAESKLREEKSIYLHKKLKELSVRQEKAKRSLLDNYEFEEGNYINALTKLLNENEVNKRVEKLIQEVDTAVLSKRALAPQVSRWDSISFGVVVLGVTFVGAAAVLCYVYFTQKGKEHKKEENEEKKEDDGKEEEK